MAQVGRHGEAAGGRFVEFKLTKIGFGGMTAPEKVHRLFRVEVVWKRILIFIYRAAGRMFYALLIESRLTAS